MTKSEEKRAELEVKILAIFQAVQDMPEACEKGIGRYSIKRALLLDDKYLKVSINTIKKIVDSMLDNKVIECVNPGEYGARFRLADDFEILQLLSELQNADELGEG